MPRSTATLGCALFYGYRNGRQAKLPFAKKQSELPSNALNQKSLRAAKMYNPESVAGSDLVLHSVKMVLYRLFRQAELVRDFLVRQSLRNQRNNLLFAPR